MIWISLLVLAANAQAPQTVSVTATHTALRAAIRAGDAAAVAAQLGAPGASGTPSAVPVGLVARGRLVVGDGAGACAPAFLSTLDTAGVAGDAWRVRCAGKSPTPQTAITAAVRVVKDAPALLFADDDIADAVIAVGNAAGGADRDVVLVAALTRSIPTFEKEGRARMAKVLRALADREGQHQKAARARLVFDLPELATDADVAALGDEADGVAGRLRRASTLEARHENAEVLKLLSTLAKTDCEAALLVGKTERKRKRYQAARQSFGVAAKKTCSDEQQKKAMYLNLRVAAVQRSPIIDAVAKAFVDRFGADPLVDDVLLWSAEVQMARGDVALAVATLERLVAEHDSGDMVDEARFRLAMHHAADGDAATAIAQLEASVTHLKTQPAWRSPDLDRATYWAARLKAAPDPATLPSSATTTDVSALLSLAAARPTSFYGHLAAQMAAHLSGKPVVTPPMPTRAGGDVVVPAALAADVAWGHAVAAAAAGFDDAAVVLANDVAVGRGDVAVAAAIAALFSSLDRPDLAHQGFRQRGLAQLPGFVGDDVKAWSLAWPLAYQGTIAAAATGSGVPPWLLQGLAREESAFDASVVSWAGAVGLCQLMPATAADEAKSLKWPKLSTAVLTDPAKNAMLGASHLGRRLKGMGHPFKAIAAYNAGPGSVAKWMPPAGTQMPIDTWVEGITFDETRNYVKKVTGSWVTYTRLAGEAPPAFPLIVVGR
jgi:soluble lytic murein transglycosylase